LELGGCPLGGLFGCEVVTRWNATICLAKGDNEITVTASGSKGSATESFVARLDKDGAAIVPTAPDECTVRAHPEQITVTWQPNPSDQNILSYDIYMAESEWSQWDESLPGARIISAVPCCSHTIENLTNDKTYWIALAANNCAGRGASTSPDSATPELLPTSIRVTPESDILAVGASRSYEVEILDSLGNPINGLIVDWSTSDETVVMVESSGRETDTLGKTVATVNAKRIGVAELTAVVPGTGVKHVTPISVVTPLSGVKSITAGYYHSCAITELDLVKCWGWDGDGSRPSDGVGDDRVRPTEIVGLGKVLAVTAGSNTSCAITYAGGVKCWPAAGQGQLYDVPSLESGVTAISAGFRHNCAVTSGGAVKCWGENDKGQLGNGTTEGSDFPVDVFGLPGYQIAVSAGSHHTCALNSEGAIHCWGANYWGNLGSGSGNTGSPVAIDGSNNDYVAVDAGTSITCALRSVGLVQCWGWGLHRAGETPHSISEMSVENLESLTVGTEHGCAVDGNGSLFCLGANGNWRRGVPGFDSSSTLELLQTDEAVVQAAAGDDHTCILTVGGLVMCVGHNWAAQLGDGTRNNTRSTLVYVVASSDFDEQGL
jgi:alpha-tubulin suppressor-like RCC1 family protein